jgi:hypothetical protein
MDNSSVIQQTSTTKPVAILNHYFDIDEDKLTSSTSLLCLVWYGWSGYTTERDVKLTKNSLGQIDWDKAVEANKEFAAKWQGGGMYFKTHTITTAVWWLIDPEKNGLPYHLLSRC